MTIDRDMLAAYVEGHLGEAERAQVEAAIAADPALSAEVAAHQALRAQLQAHFAPVMDMPVPDRLIAAVRTPASTAEIVDLGVARAAKAEKSRIEKVRKPFAARWILGGAIAASLVLALVLSDPVLVSAPIGVTDGKLLAQGALDKALTTQLAAADPQPVRVLLSLRNAQGRYCRVFETDAMAGLACRDNGHWAIDRLQSGGSQPGGQYRQAGSALGDIMAAAQTMAPEGAMSGQQETAARDTGWK